MTLRNARDLFTRTASSYEWLRAAGPIPLERYEEARRALAERSRGISGVLGMYDLGPVRYPGLSDLDLVFVLEDTFGDFESLRPLLREAQTAATRNVLLHDPYFIRRVDLESFVHFAPIFQYRAVWAAEGLPREGAVSEPLDLVLFLMDIIAESYPREFIAFLRAPVLEERMLIGRLKGLAYCFELLERLSGRGELEFQNYAKAVTDLREGFFALAPEERSARLLRLTHEAVALAQGLALKTSEYLKEKWGLSVAGRLDLWCAGGAAIFTDAAGAEPRYGTVRLRREEVFAEAPAVYGWLVRVYAQGDGPFSARLRGRCADRLRMDGAAPVELVEAAARRAGLRNAHTAWIDAAGLGLATFLTFGYRTRRRGGGWKGVREAAGRLTERAREWILRREIGKL